MGVTNLISAFVIALLGLPVGFALAKIAKTELKAGEYYFIWLQNIIIILAVNLFFYSYNLEIYASVVIFIVSSYIAVKFKPTAILGYVILLFLAGMKISMPNISMIIMSLLFLYGLPTAALIRLEGIRELKYPFRYLRRKVRVIAHRGAPHYAPENTISSFKKAIELGADMLEIDARHTKDNKIVVMHDLTVDRTTDGRGLIKKKTFKEIRSLRIKGSSDKVPSLQEVFDLVKKNGCELNIHIKEHDAVDEVMRIIRKNKGLKKRILISSFAENALRRVKEIDPEIRTGYLMSKPSLLYISIAKKLGVDAIHPEYNLLTKRLVSRAHRNGLKINVWTIDSKKKALTAKKVYKVDGLITNDPLLYVKSRNGDHAKK